MYNYIEFNKAANGDGFYDKITSLVKELYEDSGNCPEDAKKTIDGKIKFYYSSIMLPVPNIKRGAYHLMFETSVNLFLGKLHS